MIHLGDITKISGYDAPVVDCIIGGSPCQDLSIAGKRAGLAGERSSLFMEQIRIVKEMRERDRADGRTGNMVRPRFMVWENVPGALSSNKGEDFGAVLDEIIRVAEPSAPDVPRPKKWPLADAYIGDGWSVAYRILDARFWGVPQRRRRIALVADFGGLAAPEILFVRKGVSGDTAAGGEAREGAAGGVADGACAAVHQNGSGEVRVGCVANTLTTNSNASGRNTPLICIDAVCLHPDVTGTICASGDAIFRKVSSAQYAEDQVGSTIASRDYKDNGDLICGAAVSVQAVDCRNHRTSDVSATLQAKENGGQSLNYINPVFADQVVRRLTPLECERLQGYPDGWTDIGPWVDSKGKLHKESSDSARYKALGNSIALPPWRWVLKRLCACYERDATTASLFDGIGGFPLIWERLNGPGSCLWASEIEEFPMAVTRTRFGQEQPGTDGRRGHELP